jgi:hypothetical protein
MMKVAQILELTKEFSMDELTKLRLSLQRELLARGSAEAIHDWSDQQAMIFSPGAIPEPGENLEELMVASHNGTKPQESGGD